ncbi:hypothetical protein SGPA1_90033 [Streptomyces misionensis JCM 4497]
MHGPRHRQGLPPDERHHQHHPGPGRRRLHAGHLGEPHRGLHRPLDDDRLRGRGEDGGRHRRCRRLCEAERLGPPDRGPARRLRAEADGRDAQGQGRSGAPVAAHPARLGQRSDAGARPAHVPELHDPHAQVAERLHRQRAPDGPGRLGRQLPQGLRGDRHGQEAVRPRHGDEVGADEPHHERDDAQPPGPAGPRQPRRAQPGGREPAVRDAARRRPARQERRQGVLEAGRGQAGADEDALHRPVPARGAGAERHRLLLTGRGAGAGQDRRAGARGTGLRQGGGRHLGIAVRGQDGRRVPERGPGGRRPGRGQGTGHPGERGAQVHRGLRGHGRGRRRLAQRHGLPQAVQAEGRRHPVQRRRHQRRGHRLHGRVQAVPVVRRPGCLRGKAPRRFVSRAPRAGARR